MIKNSEIIKLTRKILADGNNDINAYNQVLKSSLVNTDIFTSPNQAKITSEAWYALDRFLNHMYLTHKELSVIVRCGEEIILGTFIAGKLDQNIDNEELKNSFIKNMLEVNPEAKIVHDPTFYHLDRYFDFCAGFGIQEANK